MNSFFKKIFLRKGKSDTKKFMGKVSTLIKLSHDIDEKTKVLNELEYSLLIEKKEEVYISLADFIMLMDKNDLKITDIMEKCKHISDLNSEKYSSIAIHSVVENDHIVLCPDIFNCEFHKNLPHHILNIVSIRR